MTVERRMKYVDVTTRDGHQSLWATRMTNEMILPIVPHMDTVGFDWINLEGPFSTYVFDSFTRTPGSECGSSRSGSDTLPSTS